MATTVTISSGSTSTVFDVPTTAESRKAISGTGPTYSLVIGARGPQGPSGAPTQSATPPSDTRNPWFDTTTGIISIWYVDAWLATNATVTAETNAITLGGNTLTFTGETLTFGT